MTALQPIFIGGCGRSGTTVLGTILGRQSEHVCPPEAQFVVRTLRESAASSEAFIPESVLSDWRLKLWGIPDHKVREIALSSNSVPDLARRLAAAYASLVGKADARRWVDHTPWNMKHAALLAEAFPEARFVHVVRDGRAVAASVLPLDWGPVTVRGAARWWLERLGAGLAAEQYLGPERAMRVYFEELLRSPEEVLQAICGFLGSEYDASMIWEGSPTSVSAYTSAQHALVGGPLVPARIDGWRTTLSERQVSQFELEAGDVLRFLGYRPEGVQCESPQRRFESGRETVEATWRQAVNRVRFEQRRRRGLKAVRRAREHRSGRFVND